MLHIISTESSPLDTIWKNATFFSFWACVNPTGPPCTTLPPLIEDGDGGNGRSFLIPPISETWKRGRETVSSNHRVPYIDFWSNYVSKLKTRKTSYLGRVDCCSVFFPWHHIFLAFAVPVYSLTHLHTYTASCIWGTHSRTSSKTKKHVLPLRPLRRSLLWQRSPIYMYIVAV